MAVNLAQVANSLPALSTNRETDSNKKQPTKRVVFQPEQFPHVVCHTGTHADGHRAGI